MNSGGFTHQKQQISEEADITKQYYLGSVML